MYFFLKWIRITHVIQSLSFSCDKIKPQSPIWIIEIDQVYRCLNIYYKQIKYKINWTPIANNPYWIWAKGLAGILIAYFYFLLLVFFLRTISFRQVLIDIWLTWFLIFMFFTLRPISPHKIIGKSKQISMPTEQTLRETYLSCWIIAYSIPRCPDKTISIIHSVSLSS